MSEYALFLYYSAMTSKDYKNAKRFDFIGQVLVCIVSYLIAKHHEDNLEYRPYLYVYFYLGGWQVISAIVWKISSPQEAGTSGINIYFILILFLIFIMIVSFASGILGGLLILLFMPPILAIYYFIFTIVGSIRGFRQLVSSEKVEEA